MACGSPWTPSLKELGDITSHKPEIQNTLTRSKQKCGPHPDLNPQFPISSKVRHFRCVEFGVSVAIGKRGTELNLAALGSSNKTQAKTFLSVSTLTFPGVALGSFLLPKGGSTQIPHYWTDVSKRQLYAVERADLGVPRPGETSVCQALHACAWSGETQEWASVLPDLNHSNHSNQTGRLLLKYLKELYRYFLKYTIIYGINIPVF